MDVPNSKSDRRRVDRAILRGNAVPDARLASFALDRSRQLRRRSLVFAAAFPAVSLGASLITMALITSKPALSAWGSFWSDRFWLWWLSSCLTFAILLPLLQRRLLRQSDYLNGRLLENKDLT